MAKQVKDTKVNMLEVYFEWYMNELKEAGFVLDIKREKFAIEVTPPMPRKRYNFSTKEPKIEDYNIFKPLVYTADYMIKWAPHAKEIFFNLLEVDSPLRIWCPFYAQIDSKGVAFSLVDVKPTYAASQFSGYNASSISFPLNQKFIYYLYGIYINKAITIPTVAKGEVKSGNNVALFTTTFCPNRYLLTDGGLQGRDIKFNKRSLREYISYKTKEIDKINSILSTQAKLNLQ